MIGSGDRDREIVITPQVVSKGHAGGVVTTAGLPIYEWARKTVAKQETRYLTSTQNLFSEVMYEIAWRNDISISAHLHDQDSGITYDVVHCAEKGYKDTLQIYCRSQNVQAGV